MFNTEKIEPGFDNAGVAHCNSVPLDLVVSVEIGLLCDSSS